MLHHYEFPLDQVDAKVKEIAQEMIKNSDRAIKLAKRLFQRGTYENPSGFLAESDAATEDFASGEPFKMVAAFFEEKNSEVKKE